MAAVEDAVAIRRPHRIVEWPSIALCTGIYCGFLLLTWFYDALPLPLVIVVGSLLIAWHSSMQHEFIHGHPTPWRRLNRALASPPLILWLPFESYRRSHLVHHCDEQLTDPLDDPESHYWSIGSWAAIGPIGRMVVRAHTTLAGRLIIGPAWIIGRYWLMEAKALVAGDRQRRRIWAWHAVALAALLLWVVFVCRMNILVYLAMSYSGTALLLLRSFAEHRANQSVIERTAIVENAWLFGPLYLFNNLHAAHHERPLIPWYELPAWYKANRRRLLQENGGLVYDGYGEVVRRFLLRPHHVLLHPLEPRRATLRG